MNFNTITETSNLIRNKKISVKELSEIFIKRIKENTDLNAFIFFNEDLIIKRAKEIDSLKEDLSLKGIPLGIKDLFCTKNMPTTAGSKF